MLSGLPSESDAAHFMKTPALAVMGIYSDKDFGASSLTAAVKLSKHPQSEVKMYAGSGHGVELFTSQPTLVK